MRNLPRSARLLALSNLVLLAACSSADDGEGTGTTEAAIGAGETVTLPTGTVPKKLVVSTAATQCPISTDCSRSWTDRFVDDVFKKHDPDVVVMTELFWNATYRNVVDQVGRVRPNVYNFYRGPRDGFINGAGGTVIASKYPMSRKTERAYVAKTIPDSFTNKGVAVARQRLGALSDGQPVYVDVLATHHQAITVGDFVGVIRSQMGEQARFIREPAVWGGAGGGTLKIFTGDLNVAGDGPTWLGAKNVQAGKNAFGWLRDNTLLPYGFRDGMDTCAEQGTGGAATCASRAFVEKEPYEVMKQMHTPYSKLVPEGGASPDPNVERGIYMIPEKLETFRTPADHDAKQVTYGLYIHTKRQQTTITESKKRRDHDAGLDAAPPHEE